MRFSGNACELVFIIEAQVPRVTTVGYFDFPHNGAPLPETLEDDVIEVDRVAPAGDGWFRVYIRHTCLQTPDVFKETVDYHQEFFFYSILEKVGDYLDREDGHPQLFFFEGVLY